jgi:hypothetical protein
MQATPFDASAILPWEWDQVIDNIRDRPVCERDLIVMFVLDGGCGYETGTLLAKLALVLPDDAAIRNKCTMQPTDGDALALGIFNQDEDLVAALKTSKTTRIPRRSRKPRRKTRTSKKLAF